MSASTSITTRSFSNTYQVSFISPRKAKQLGNYSPQKKSEKCTLIRPRGIAPGINLFDYLHKLHKSIPVGKQLGVSVQVISVFPPRCARFYFRFSCPPHRSGAVGGKLTKRFYQRLPFLT